MKCSLPIDRQKLTEKFLLILTFGVVFLFSLALQVSARDFSPDKGGNSVITGKVTGDNGAALTGVSVVIKGTTKGTTTDALGMFSINASSTDVLVFSYVGYLSHEVAVGTQSEINVTMVLSTKELDQVVVVGYGTQRKVDVTGSVAHVGGAELVKEPVLTATQAIQGKVAGVQIVSSGQPGSAPQVIIRGTGSILGGANPLYVVDGLVLPRAMILLISIQQIYCL